MARALVRDKEDVLANFKKLIELRESPNPDNVRIYQSYLKAAKVLVVAKVNGRREYGPSRFVGYFDNTLRKHKAGHSDGTVTNARLREIFGNLFYADPEEDKNFAKFCDKHGITKNLSGLNTPIKYIFGWYHPSDQAIRSKSKDPDATDTPVLDIDEDLEDAPVAMPLTPRNQILYGPPGTGKTYHTTARAVALLEGITDEAVATQYPPEKRGELRQKFEDYRAAGRVAFVTFHQAFSYEDFMEGIKPLPPTSSAEGDVLSSSTGVQYDVQAGIFSRICETAFTAANATVAPPVPAFDELYADFAELLRHRMSETRGLLTFSSKTGEPMVLKAVANGPLMRLTFLHGNSGQLDHHIDKPWIKKLYEKYDSIDQIKKLKQDITDVVGGSNATLMWVVFNELKKHEAAWLARARETERQKLQDNTAPPFVLIIDEINRGNVANIFGELITLLEDDKRAGRAEAVKVQLPYSKKAFSVPDNLFVLGTMNTADRSVEALDTALRRRFSFTEMLPQPELLSPYQMISRLWWHEEHRTCGWYEEPYVSAEKKLYAFLGCEDLAKENQEPRWLKMQKLGSTPENTRQLLQDVTMTGIDLEQLLRAINARLEQLLDHDHCIGHALLIHVQDFAGLQQAFQRNILPLLKEYFFGDWGKIGLVLGEAFIIQVNKSKAAGTIGLKKFSGYSVGELSEKPVYHFVDPQSLEPKDFQEIYA
jgi:5-methylcytosine-specific restriction protein B